MHPLTHSLDTHTSYPSYDALDYIVEKHADSFISSSSSSSSNDGKVKAEGETDNEQNVRDGGSGGGGGGSGGSGGGIYAQLLERLMIRYEQGKDRDRDLNRDFIGPMTGRINTTYQHTLSTHPTNTSYQPIHPPILRSTLLVQFLHTPGDANLLSFLLHHFSFLIPSFILCDPLYPLLPSFWYPPLPSLALVHPQVVVIPTWLPVLVVAYVEA